MANVKSNDSLAPNEIYMLTFENGYNDYYSFGFVPQQLIDKIIEMYNRNVVDCFRCNYTEFRKFVKENDLNLNLYKVPIDSVFGFSNEELKMETIEAPITSLGNYYKFNRRNNKPNMNKRINEE